MTYRKPDFKNAYLSKIINSWFGRPRTDVQISVKASRIEYRMTLGSVYYDLESKNLMTSIKSTTTPIEKQAWLYLKRYYPRYYNMCVSVRGQTRNHLTEIRRMLILYVFTPVQNMINELRSKYPELKDYYETENPRGDYFVFENIIESVYQEIQHYSIVGNRLDFFKLDLERSRVGNGNTYMVCSNPHALSDFVHSVDVVINNRIALQSFRNATAEKARIETSVFALEKNLEGLLLHH